MSFNNGFFIQFIRLAGPFWNSENKAAIRKQTLALVLLTVSQMLIAVAITEWSAALFNNLERHSMPGLWKLIGLLVLIFAANIAITVSHLQVKRKLQVGWRNWLTEKVTQRWMAKERHYQVTHIQTSAHDNPDGRIADDIRIATEEAIALSHTLIYSLLVLSNWCWSMWVWRQPTHYTIDCQYWSSVLQCIQVVLLWYRWVTLR